MCAERHLPSESLAGSLLLAHPALVDPNFRRSVVFIATHNGEGAMGIIINRPLDRKLGDMEGEYASGPLAGLPLFEGGPVQKDRVIIAGWRTQGLGFQLLLGIDMGKAGELLAGNGLALRGMQGYSGWSPGQLENEIECGSWIVARPPTDLFSDPESRTLWRRLLRHQGDEWRLQADEPDAPGLN